MKPPTQRCMHAFVPTLLFQGEEEGEREWSLMVLVRLVWQRHLGCWAGCIGKNEFDEWDHNGKDYHDAHSCVNLFRDPCTGQILYFARNPQSYCHSRCSFRIPRKAIERDICRCCLFFSWLIKKANSLMFLLTTTPPQALRPFL